MRRTLTDKGVAGLKPRAERYALPDPQMVGHYVRVQPTGAEDVRCSGAGIRRQAGLDRDRRR